VVLLARHMAAETRISQRALCGYSICMKRGCTLSIEQLEKWRAAPNTGYQRDALIGRGDGLWVIV